MERPKLIGLVALCTMLGCGLFSAARGSQMAAAGGLLHAGRGVHRIGYGICGPAWEVLAHQARPKVPARVLEMEFKRSKKVLGPSGPPLRFGEGSPERGGFAIGKQNCLRCHSAGPYGGTK